MSFSLSLQALDSFLFRRRFVVFVIFAAFSWRTSSARMLWFEPKTLQLQLVVQYCIYRWATLDPWKELYRILFKIAAQNCCCEFLRCSFVLFKQFVCIKNICVLTCGPEAGFPAPSFEFKKLSCFTQIFTKKLTISVLSVRSYVLVHSNFYIHLRQN